MIDINPSHDDRPNRLIERVGRYGSPEKEELENGFAEEALFTKNGPNEATLMGARSTWPTTGGGDWTCRKPDHWLFAGTEMKEGEGIPGLVGWEVGTRQAREDSGPRDRRQRENPGAARVDGLYTATDLSRPQGQLRLQRRHDLVGRRPLRAAGLPSAVGIYAPARA